LYEAVWAFGSAIFVIPTTGGIEGQGDAFDPSCRRDDKKRHQITEPDDHRQVNHSTTQPMPYFHDIAVGIRSTLTGLGLTFRHLRAATHRRTAVGVESANYFDVQNGLVTLQYPHEQLPIPDNGRYRLHNEMDDCIVCDKCAKVCPVDCIDIEPIRAVGEVGKASDGSPIRLYAAKFDIDMAKCMFCGLCTVVCPTECLTMEKTFDFSTYQLDALTYAFGNLTPAEADEKRQLYEQFTAEKEAAKVQKVAQSETVAATSEPVADKPATPAKRPPFRPSAKPPIPAAVSATSSESAVFEPTPDQTEAIAMRDLPPSVDLPAVSEPMTAAEIAAVLPDAPAPETPAEPAPAPKRPAFRPSMKPKSE
jgi:formate hydrogenlyase subunit 6/NADH:ubiquinone oxidoreductase subunit I